MSEESKSKHPYKTALIVLIAGIIGFFGGVFAMGISDGWTTKDSCWQVAAAGGNNETFVKINTCTGESYQLSGWAWYKLEDEKE